MGDESSTSGQALFAADASARPATGAGQQHQPFVPTGTELLELVADGIVSTDGQGRIILFNKAAEALFGYERHEVLGRPVEILLPGRAREEHREAVATVAALADTDTAVGHRRDVVGRRKDGREFPAEASLSRRVADGCVVLTAVIRDVTARKQAEEQRLILSRELAHRFKNMMALVSSIVSLTARNAGTKEALVTSLRGRLAALARTHQMLLDSESRSADLRTMLESELAPYRIHTSSNICLEGEPCTLLGPQVVNLSMAVHELATNAAKYGALSRATGKVQVRWSVESGILHLHWHEAGGPTVRKPTAIGFGTELIRRLLGPEARLEYQRSGFQAFLTISLHG